MPYSEEEIHTQTVQSGDTEIEKTTVSQHSSNDGADIVKRIAYFIYSILAGLLIIRIVLSLLGANRTNAFADFIYTITGPLVSPFRGLFNIDTSYGVSRLDVESLVAILVLGLIAWVVYRAASIGSNNSSI